eukprot:UN27390
MKNILHRNKLNPICSKSFRRKVKPKDLKVDKHLYQICFWGNKEFIFNILSYLKAFVNISAFLFLMGNPAFKAVQEIPIEDRESVFQGDSPDIDALIKGLKSKRFKNIVVLAGAGMSVSAGIPDFRTPGTGLYDNLQKYNLPTPEAVFSIDFFRTNPQPFCDLAKELWPGSLKPTVSHFFIKLLHDKGLLRRIYTQNIDGLEA